MPKKNVNLGSYIEKALRNMHVRPKTGSQNAPTPYRHVVSRINTLNRETSRIQKKIAKDREELQELRTKLKKSIENKLIHIPNIQKQNNTTETATSASFQREQMQQLRQLHRALRDKILENRHIQNELEWLRNQYALLLRADSAYRFDRPIADPQSQDFWKIFKDVINRTFRFCGSIVGTMALFFGVFTGVDLIIEQKTEVAKSLSDLLPVAFLILNVYIKIRDIIKSLLGTGASQQIPEITQDELSDIEEFMNSTNDSDYLGDSAKTWQRFVKIWTKLIKVTFMILKVCTEFDIPDDFGGDDGGNTGGDNDNSKLVDTPEATPPSSPESQNQENVEQPATSSSSSRT